MPTLAAGRRIDDPEPLIPEVVGHVRYHQRISQTSGGFTGLLQPGDSLGRSIASLGDLDGDGTVDLAVGSPGDDGAGPDRGAVWIFFLRPNGSVKAHQKISDTDGGFTGALGDFDDFGFSVAPLGDLDGDGTPDLAVGAVQDDDGGPDRGAIWVLFLHPNGTVKGHQKISATAGGFSGTLDDMDLFGSALAPLGDLDGDGTGELAVGAFLDDDGGADRGAVWILFLHANGSVKGHQKISATDGGFTGTLDDADLFGSSLTSLGSLEDDGTARLVVGAPGDDDGSLDAGALWILVLQPNGTVATHHKVSATEGGFTGTLDEGDQLGGAAASLGDLDCDGTGDLAVGATEDDDGGTQRGAVWVLFLSPRTTVKLHTKISDTSGSFTGALDDGDAFGSALAALGDLDGDGHVDLAVGAERDDDGGPFMSSDLGAVWNLFLDGTECADPTIFQDGFEFGDLDAWDGVTQ